MVEIYIPDLYYLGSHPCAFWLFQEIPLSCRTTQNSPSCLYVVRYRVGTEGQLLQGGGIEEANVNREVVLDTKG
jgi:hypothetical protein